MAEGETWLHAALLSEDYEVRTQDGEWLPVLSVAKDPRSPTRFVLVHVEGLGPQSYLTEALIPARPRRED